MRTRRKLPRGSGLGTGLAGGGDLWPRVLEGGGQSRQREQRGHGRDVPKGEVVSNFKVVSMKWMSMFWTPDSSKDAHSFIDQETVVLPTPIKTSMEPGNSRYMAFPGNKSSGRNSFAETQVVDEVSRPSE